MEKELEKVTEKLENMQLLARLNDFSIENANMIFTYSNDLLIHSKRLSQILAELPRMTNSAPQVLEGFNTDSTMELADNVGESEMDEDRILLDFLNSIDISDVLMHIKQLLMTKIGEIILVSIQLMFLISI